MAAKALRRGRLEILAASAARLHPAQVGQVETRELASYDRVLGLTHFGDVGDGSEDAVRVEGGIV